MTPVEGAGAEHAAGSRAGQSSSDRRLDAGAEAGPPMRRESRQAPRRSSSSQPLAQCHLRQELLELLPDRIAALVEAGYLFIEVVLAMTLGVSEPPRVRHRQERAGASRRARPRDRRHPQT